MPVPFFIRRPWLMLSQWLTDRDRPDLEALRAIRDPDKFLWAILPHAARTFASCITLLPPDKARAAAVGYLYCRSLDTYEDLAPEPEKLLEIFGRRFEDRTPTTPGSVSPSPARRSTLVRLFQPSCKRVSPAHQIEGSCRA